MSLSEDGDDDAETGYKEDRSYPVVALGCTSFGVTIAVNAGVMQPSQMSIDCEAYISNDLSSALRQEDETCKKGSL